MAVTVDLRLGDCLEVMKSIPSGSVDAVVTDPPYGIGKAEWDKIDDYPAFCAAWIAGAARCAKRQAAFWCFHSDPLVMSDIARLFIGRGKSLRNWVTWNKFDPDNGYQVGYTVVGSLRQFQDFCEYAVYCADDGAWDSQTDKLRGFLFEPLRAYLADEWARAGLTKKDADIATVSFMSGHYLTRSQWALPTAEMYARLRAYANKSGGEYLRREYEYLRREYEDLRREYEDLRREYEDLRPTFNIQPGVAAVWFYPPAAQNGHVTPKPEAMMRRIVEATTRLADTILDPFMGSGTTGVACVQTGRSFIGIEIDEGYFKIAQKRIAEAQLQMPMFPAAETTK